MGKSVYSLVLGDEVIAAADRVAYQKNMSRSALINQILAEAPFLRDTGTPQSFCF